MVGGGGWDLSAVNLTSSGATYSPPKSRRILPCYTPISVHRIVIIAIRARAGE